MATIKELKAISILSVANQLGMSLNKIGRNTYSWQDHDSFVINARDNYFNWFSRSTGGDVIRMVQLVKEELSGEKVSFKQAKHFLENGEFEAVEVIGSSDDKEPFNYYLERYETSFKEARDYLTQQRKLSEETIDFFLSQGVMAQATKKTGEYYEPVIVFKSLNRQKKLSGACLQGIKVNNDLYEKGRLKQIMRGSDGTLGMSVDIGKPNRLVFAESPIDLMSYYELHKDVLQEVRLVAMNGLKESLISRHVVDFFFETGVISGKMEQDKIPVFLADMAQVSTFFKENRHQDLITLAVDNDEAGHTFIARLEEKGIGFIQALPPNENDQRKVDWNDYLKAQSESGLDNSRLGQARRKLERLKGELDSSIQTAYTHQSQANGQPMNDKKNGDRFLRKQERLENNIFSKMEEIKQQEERIERLEWQGENKALGLNKQGTGLEMSVQNIPRIREEIEKFTRGESHYTVATIKRYTQELAKLEAIQEKIAGLFVQPRAQALIDSKEVNQWKKRPSIYFVKGLRGVALELNDEGFFEVSSNPRYQPKTEEEHLKVTDLLERQKEFVAIKPDPVNVLMGTEKALDRDQRLTVNTGGELFNRNSGFLEDEPSRAAPQPDESKIQPDFPTNVQLNFNIDRSKESSVGLRNGYRYATDKDIRYLNRYAEEIQKSAEWYLNELADSKVTYFYQDKEDVRMLQIEFEKRHWMHLTGIAPVYHEWAYSLSEQFIDDIASGKGDFANLLVGRGFRDKTKLLPILPELFETDSFVFGDLSSVEKLGRLDVSSAICSDDRDILLALRTDDDSTFPATLLKPSRVLNIALDSLNQEKTILGVFVEKGSTLKTLSINHDLVADTGQGMLETLRIGQKDDSKILKGGQTMADNQQFNLRGRFNQDVKENEIERDSDGDGLSDELEKNMGTNPYSTDMDGDGKSDYEEVALGSNPIEDETVKPKNKTVVDFIAAKDTKGLAALLKEGVKEYFQSDTYKQFLLTMSKFYNYSPRNIQMILKQKPDAQAVASFKKWKKEFERHVKKGEQAIRIFAPIIVKQKDPKTGEVLLDDEGKEITYTAYKLVPVFDVSQTSGKELTKAVYELEGSYEDFAKLYKAIKDVASSKGISITFSDQIQNANGYYSLSENKIVIKKGLSEQQTLKTIFHEMAHADLHNSDNIQGMQLTKSTAELQAESVAFVVSSHYGIDTSEYNFGYLASWTQDPVGLSDLENQLKIVQKEASNLINRIDGTLEKLKTKEVTKDVFAEKINRLKEQSEQEKIKGSDAPKKALSSDKNIMI